MGFSDGQPAFMIYKDKYSWSAKAGKWKMMIGDVVYDEKIRKGHYERGRRGSTGRYVSYEQIKNAFGEKDIMDALPDGSFEMQLITIDPNRLRLRKERSELAKMAGADTKDGIQKATVYKYILGKVKPQVDELVKKVSDEIRENLITAIEEIFNPEVDYPKGIDVNISDTVDKLQEIAKKLKEARHTIDGVFPYSAGHASPEEIQALGKARWESDKKKYDDMKELIKNGISI